MNKILFNQQTLKVTETKELFVIRTNGSEGDRYVIYRTITDISLPVNGFQPYEKITIFNVKYVDRLKSTSIHK